MWVSIMDTIHPPFAHKRVRKVGHGVEYLKSWSLSVRPGSGPHLKVPIAIGRSVRCTAAQSIGKLLQLMPTMLISHNSRIASRDH